MRKLAKRDEMRAKMNKEKFRFRIFILERDLCRVLHLLCIITANITSLDNIVKAFLSIFVRFDFNSLFSLFNNSENCAQGKCETFSSLAEVLFAYSLLHKFLFIFLMMHFTYSFSHMRMQLNFFPSMNVHESRMHGIFHLFLSNIFQTQKSLQLRICRDVWVIHWNILLFTRLNRNWWWYGVAEIFSADSKTRHDVDDVSQFDEYNEALYENFLIHISQFSFIVSMEQSGKWNEKEIFVHFIHWLIENWCFAHRKHCVKCTTICSIWFHLKIINSLIFIRVLCLFYKPQLSQVDK